MSVAVIIDYDGRQFHCTEGNVITVNRLSCEVGESVSLAPVIACIDGENIEFDKGKLQKMSVTATVVNHARTGKIVSRKYRRRKSSRSTYVHRQPTTRLTISAIRTE